MMALSRLLLAGLFLSAAALKGYEAPAFRTAIGDLMTAWWPGSDGLPEIIRYPGIAIATTLVITWEATVGSMLLASGLVRLGLRIATGTLVVFLLVLISMLFLPDPPSCGCFGGAGTSSSDARTDIILGIVRNIALIVLAMWTLRCLAARQAIPQEATAELRCA
jgi:hypothetical protein